MVKLYDSLVCSHLTYALLAWGRSGRTNVANIECAHMRACKLLTDYKNDILTFHSIYDCFASLQAFNINTYLDTWILALIFINKSKTNYLLQPSHMHNTRHKTNSNFNTPLYNHSKTQKCYLYQIIPRWNRLPCMFA